MSEVEVRQHATRLISWHNMDYEYALVYEDDELQDATEEEWRAIHDAMNSARVTVDWEPTP